MHCAQAYSKESESVSASERQDEEQMPRETGTRQGRDPAHRGPTQRGGPRRGPTTGGEGHIGDPHRTHIDTTGWPQLGTGP